MLGEALDPRDRLERRSFDPSDRGSGTDDVPNVTCHAKETPSACFAEDPDESRRTSVTGDNDEGSTGAEDARAARVRIVRCGSAAKRDDISREAGVVGRGRGKRKEGQDVGKLERTR